MWLPSAIYEKAPHYWLLLGLLFIIIGMYLGFEVQREYLYAGIGLGVACCLWGFRVMSQRKPRETATNVDDYLDQTCELSYKPDDN